MNDADRPDVSGGLDSLISRINVRASLLHSGPLCGDNDARMFQGKGHVHVVQRGHAEVRHEHHPALYITEPTLLFYPQALTHRFVTDARSGADFVCATVTFSAGVANPVVQALPQVLAMPLSQVPALCPTIDLLFAEAFGESAGRQSTVDRLFEVLLIQLLRTVIDRGLISTGLLAGLAHPKLSKAMIALHESPAHPWTLQELARLAGMSRTRFADAFKATVKSTTGAYIAGRRLSLAQDLLRRALPLKLVATEVGYRSAAALTRVFKAHVGTSPRAWLRSLR